MPEKNTINGEIVVSESSTRPIAVVEAPRNPVAEFDFHSDAGLDRAVEFTKRAIEYVNRVLRAALSTARSGSIIDQDGKPYFTKNECARLLRMLGGATTELVSSRIVRDEDGSGHWGNEVVARVSHPVLGSAEGMGFAHTTDKFLGTNYGTSRRTLDRVSRHNLRQHAFTRAKGAAIRELLDLSGRTWAELESLGLERGKGASVKYDKGTGGKGKNTRAAKKDDLGAELSALTKSGVTSWSELGSIAAKIGYTDGRLLDAPDEIKRKVLAKFEGPEGGK